VNDEEAHVRAITVIHADVPPITDLPNPSKGGQKYTREEWMCPQGDQRY